MAKLIFRTQTNDSISPTRRVGLAGVVLAALVGCSPNPDAEVSSKSTKYEAAGAESSKESGASKPEGDVVAKGGPSNGTPPQVAADANVPPVAQPFSPTTADAADSRSFMVLKPTESKEPKGIMQYLAEADNAFRELILAMQARQITQDVMMGRGSAIAKMKLEAAEKLVQAATDPTEKDVGLFAKIEALSHLAGFGDTAAAKDLEEVAKEISTISNPKMVHQANLVLFSFRVSEYDSGQLKTAEPLLAEMDRLLADKTLLSLPDFRMMMQTLQVIQKQGDEAAVNAARLKIANAFSDHDDARLVMEAWRLKVTGSPEEQALQKSLQAIVESDGTVKDLAPLKGAVDGMIATFPDAPTLLVIGNNALQIEYSGATEAAKIMIDAIKGKGDTVKNEMFQKELQRVIGDFDQRFGLLGKPVDFTSLVDGSGKAFDAKSLEGKVVLVDLWATWCGPCLATFPELKEVYAEYKDKGFEIVGVNIDDQASELDTFQKKDPLPWTLVRSVDPQDPKAIGFECPLAKKLGVTAIPMLVLMDKKGNAAALHTRGQRLRDKITELLAAP